MVTGNISGSWETLGLPEPEWTDLPAPVPTASNLGEEPL